MPANADECPRIACLCRLREIDDLGNVRQIVAGKRDDVRPPIPQQAKIGAMVLDLQIDEPDLVAGDLVEIECAAIGVLRNPVARES